MEDKKKISIVDRVWDFFSSVKLVIILFIILSLTSIIGTIIEQQAEPEKNIRLLTKIFGEGLAPILYEVFFRLGFMDMYRSWWFVTLLLLFSSNIIICSFERLPKIWRFVNEPMKPVKEDVINNLQTKKELKVKAGLSKAKDVVLNALKSAGFNASESKEEGGAVQFYSQKGRYTRLGVYIVHLSVILILAGAIIGIFFGFKGSLNLPEGEASSVAYSRSGKEIPLGFTIKCNWYDTEYYGMSDMPKEYQSELIIVEGGREVLKKVIEVNTPLTYKGITFYQSSYGMVPNATGEFILRIVPKGRQESILRLRPNEVFEIPGTAIKGRIINFSPAIAQDPSGMLFTYADQMVNPAVGIEFTEGNKPKFTGWILKRYPTTGLLPEGHKVEFIDYWGVEYTGLQVRKDPGVWVVYFGCITITIGLFMAFFMSHKKIWVRLTEDKGHTKVRFGGIANKNKLSFQRDVDKMAARILTAFEGRRTDVRMINNHTETQSHKE
ncbi:MAG: cytochrome c biogenesis protein ResB [Nitrospirae bacterium]|nr:cytochrome c biogenesis protein ResB [Nitrospirota bacterium]